MELLPHHCQIAEDLARRVGSPRQVAEWYTREVLDTCSVYGTRDLSVRERYIDGVAQMVEAARRGERLQLSSEFAGIVRNPFGDDFCRNYCDRNIRGGGDICFWRYLHNQISTLLKEEKEFEDLIASVKE